VGPAPLLRSDDAGGAAAVDCWSLQARSPIQAPLKPRDSAGMVPSETRSLGRAVAVLLAVSVLRWACSELPDAPGAAVGEDVLTTLIDSTRDAVGEAEQRSRPLEPGETIDPNQASAVDLDRLPRIGPAMAERIIESRREAPFRSVDELLRVRGIGTATLERLRPFLRIGSRAATR